MTKVLANANKIKALAEKYSKYKNMFYLWRNLLFPIALEGSLKLKEITVKHIHQEN
jgi:glucosamine--fructose-6-phosphate aminotransferase (isomerizing)